MSKNSVSVRVWGEFACFTRPEMKVERVSYPVMTPSAARGILEAIFWEPEMYYVIDSIRVVKRGQWVSFRRNELVKVINLDEAHKWMQTGKYKPILAGGGANDGTQRNMLALEDVEYVITAEIRLSELGRRSGQNIAKYRDELRRRVTQGKCYHRPAMGVREFSADFEWVDDPTTIEHADWSDEDFGIMLYDVFDPLKRNQGFRWRKGENNEYDGVALTPQAVFFHAKIEGATMDCHPDRVEILRPKTGEE